MQYIFALAKYKHAFWVCKIIFPKPVIMYSFIILSTDGWLLDYVRVMFWRCVYMVQHIHCSQHPLML